MGKPSTSALLSALTNAIVADRIDIETARQLVIQSHAQTELEKEIDLYPTAKAAAAAMGISRSTLWRRLEASHASKG